ncbi:MAG: FtsW/RodA/SpoVE family cell cycle protein [Bacteroidales bacterium]|nr:FtsW/RodA/SpoVE family cell cycle protein [Bacteroidales bacterium]
MSKFTALVKGDRTIWVIFIFLTIVSVLAVYTSIGFTARHDLGRSPLLATLRHLGFILGGYACVWAGGRIHYKFFSQFSLLALVVSVVFLVVVLAVFGGRWFRLPVIGSIQPSELAKVSLLFFLANILAKFKDNMGDKYFVPLTLIPVLITCGLIFPENLSSAIITGTVCFIMMYVAGVKKSALGKWLLILLGFALVFVLVNMLIDKPLFRSETWASRVDKWLHPDYTIYNQENMSRMAVARGGFFGAGIGNTIHGRLMTQAHNDFIYAVIVEEAGSLIGVAILVAYSFLYLRCLVIARKCDKPFGKLVCVGVGTLIYIQALVHICVSVGVIPVTGQTLPFISYGGSAYLVMCVALGGVQSIAQDLRRRKAHEERNKQMTTVQETNTSE